MVVKSRQGNSEITGIKTKIDFLDTDQSIAESRFTLTPITWEIYLDQTIIMLFNMLMFRLNIEDLYSVDGKEQIELFFDKNPFHEQHGDQ